MFVLSLLYLLPSQSLPPAKQKGKNDCLVYGKNCPNTVDSLPERIIKLKTEIAKGKNVYTDDELKLLERRLKEDNQMLRMLKKPGK